jgi:ribokinase
MNFRDTVKGSVKDHSKKPKIVVVGSANTDFVVLVPQIPVKGETVLGGKFITARGGKGANQAVAAARLGAEVTFIARLGQDTLGREAVEAYQKEGIDTQYIARDNTEPSGVALIIVNQQGENLIAVAPGANSRLVPEDVRTAEVAIRSADCLLVQMEVPLPTVQTALELARHYQVRTILNPAPAPTTPPSPEFLILADILTPNETEVKALAGQYATPDALQTAELLQAKAGIKTLIVTLGSHGALLMSDDQKTYIPAFRINPVDTTGSGDAFNAALTVALGRGADLPIAVRYAAGAGALTATRAGAQPSLPTAAELEKFLTTAVT